MKMMTTMIDDDYDDDAQLLWVQNQYYSTIFRSQPSVVTV